MSGADETESGLPAVAGSVGLAEHAIGADRAHRPGCWSRSALAASPSSGRNATEEGPFDDLGGWLLEFGAFAMRSRRSRRERRAASAVIGSGPRAQRQLSRELLVSDAAAGWKF